MGRHTITGSISTVGQSDKDWSAMYRLFEKNRIDMPIIHNLIFSELSSLNAPEQPIIAFIDDTLLKKKGLKVDGASWKRDPCGPKFSNNFIWAQRFTQVSLAFYEKNSRCRSIPIRFEHTPVAKKPKHNATPEQLDDYKQAQKDFALPLQASKIIESVQNQIAQPIIWVADGGYTNLRVCRHIIEESKDIYIGRIRKDAKLFAIPENTVACNGKTKFYGNRLPTPDELRKEDDGLDTFVRASSGNGEHEFRIKSYKGIRAEIGGERNLKLLVVHPLKYRLTQNSRLLYREPAYIICSDENLAEEKILQYYLWRWEIELNFKDEKSLFGIHESHIWSKESVKNYPQFVAATYSLFLIACKQFFDEDYQGKYPKWRSKDTIWRTSTAKYLEALRMEMVEHGLNKTGFKKLKGDDTKLVLCSELLRHMVMAA